MLIYASGETTKANKWQQVDPDAAYSFTETLIHLKNNILNIKGPLGVN